MIVIDAGVLANAIADDGDDGNKARAEIRAAGAIAAPDLVDVETVAVLRKRWLSGTIAEGRFKSALQDLRDLDFDRYPALPFMNRAFELRTNVTPYDATYVALSEVLGWELLTTDARLAKAPGLRCPVRVLR